MPFSSCDKYKRNTKQSRGSCIMGSKRHILQAVELSETAVQIVSNPPALSNGGPIYRFFANWMAGAAPHKSRSDKQAWICDICHKQIHVRKKISIRCNRIEHWVHPRCVGIRQAQYTDTFITFVAGKNSEIGRYEFPREESLSGLGIGITIDNLQIAGIRHDVTESLKSAVRY